MSAAQMKVQDSLGQALVHCGIRGHPMNTLGVLLIGHSFVLSCREEQGEYYQCWQGDCDNWMRP